MTSTVGSLFEPVVGQGAEPRIVGRTPLQLFWQRFREDRVASSRSGSSSWRSCSRSWRPGSCGCSGIRRTRSTRASSIPVRNAHGPLAVVPVRGRLAREDVFARVLYGARVSIEIAVVATTLSVALGVLFGLTAGLLPRCGRHRHLAADRRHARLPDPAARARDRLVVLARERVCGRSDQAGPGDGHRRHRRRELDIHRPAHPRAGPLAAREGVRRGGAGRRRRERDDPLPRAAAEPRRPDRRLHDARHPAEHPARGGALVPRRRDQPAPGQLGRDARRGDADLRHRLVVLRLPRARALLTVLAFNLLGDGIRDALDPKAA